MASWFVGETGIFFGLINQRQKVKPSFSSANSVVLGTEFGVRARYVEG